MAILDHTSNHPNGESWQQPTWLDCEPHCWQSGTLNRAELHATADRLMILPIFPTACAGFADNILDTFAASWALNKVMREAPRFAFIAFLMYLHHGKGMGESGITYSRIVALYGIGSRSGVLATPTRIKAMLGLALVSGQLRQSKRDQADKRLKVLEPTEKLIAPMLIWLRGFLEAVEPVAPLLKPAVELAYLPGLFGEVMTYIIHAYRLDEFVLYEEFQEVKLFMFRENGYLTLMEILRTMRFADGGYIAQAPSVQLAKKFSMSRSTVRRLLAECEELGWLSISERGGHTLLLTDNFATQCRRWVALEIVWMAGLANAAAFRIANQASNCAV